MTFKDDFKDLTDGGGVRLSTIIHLVCYAALLCTVVLFLKLWVGEAIGRAKAEATAVTERIVRAESAKREAESQARHDQEVKVLKDEMAAVKTVPQAVKVIERYVPQAAPSVQVKREDISAAIPLPESQGYTIRTEKQEIAIAQLVTELQLARADINLMGDKLAKLQTDLDSVTRERDKWKEAASGGSKFQRFKTAMKYFGIGVGIGIAIRR